MLNQTRFRHVKRSVLLLGAAGVLASGLAAQASEDGWELEEIIVTAQKREEGVSDIASTVNVVTGKSIDKLSVVSFEELQQLTSGLTLTSVGVRGAAISLRGITHNPGSGAPASVQTYWNGLAVNANLVFQQMFDLERVEVLRGPQGTLQGDTSPAGAIILVTKKPDIENAVGQVQASLSQNGGLNTQFGISLPVIPGNLAVRVAGVYDENAAQGIENTVSGTDQSANTNAGRVSVSWQASEDMDIELVTEYTEQSLDVFTDVAGEGMGLPTLDSFDRKSVEEVDSVINRRHQLTALTVDWDFAGHSLTSQTGYIKRISSDYSDNDFSNNAPGSQDEWVITKGDEFTQELRLNSVDSGFWEYMIGLYYNKYDEFTEFDRAFAPGSSFIIPIVVPLKKETFGVYTHNTLHLTERLRGQIGLRWQKQRYFSRVDIPAFNQSLVSDENELQISDEVTGSLKLLYDLNDDVMVYGSLERGFRPGGLNITSVRFSEEHLFYNDEFSDSIELGFKASLLSNRLQLNGAVYQQTFQDHISPALDLYYDLDGDGLSDGVTPLLAFGADATIRGAELELSSILQKDWMLGVSLSYNDAKFDDGEEVPCTVFDNTNQPVIPVGAEFATCDAGGKSIGGEPNWSASLFSEYTVEVGQFEGFVRGLYKFSQARTNEDLGVDADTYGVINLFAGLRDGAESWEVSFWAKNLLNKEAERLIYTEQSNGYREVDIIPERTLGVTGKYYFNL